MIPIKRHIKKVKFAEIAYPIIKKSYSRLFFFLKNKFTKKISKKELFEQFKNIGIYPSERIILNSSLSKIGLLENGGKTFVDALKEYITPNGLIVMSTYPHTNSFKYLEAHITFEVNHTPSKNGVITEYFRNSEGVTRSIHPTHPLAAWGKDSKKLMSGHELAKSPYDYLSPYKKLLDLDVKCLLVGVNLNHAVMIRIIDDLYDEYLLSPYIPNILYEVEVKGYEDEAIIIKTPCHDPLFSKERNNMAIFPFMKDSITFGKLGLAKTWVFSSQDLFNTQIDCAKKQVYPFYKLPLKARS